MNLMKMPGSVVLGILILLTMPGLVKCRSAYLPPPSSPQLDVGIWKKQEDVNEATDKLIKNSQEFEEDLFVERGLIAEKVGSIWETTGETRTFVALKFSSFTGILPQSELTFMAANTSAAESNKTANGLLQSDSERAIQQMVVCQSLNSSYTTFVEVSRHLGKKKNLFNYLKRQEVLDKHLKQCYDYMMTTCSTTGRKNNAVLDKFREELANNGLSYRLQSVMEADEPDDEDVEEEDAEEEETEEDNEDDDDEFDEEDAGEERRRGQHMEKNEVVKGEEKRNETSSKSSKQRMIENIDKNTGLRPHAVLSIPNLWFIVRFLTQKVIALFVSEEEAERWKDLGTYHDFAGWERNFLANVQKTAEMSTEVFNRLLEEIFYKHKLNRAFFDDGSLPTLEDKKENIRKFYRRLLDEYHFKDTVYDTHPLEALKLLRVHPIQWDNKEQALIVEIIAPTYRTQNEPEDLYDVQHIGTLLRQPTIEEPEGYRRIKFPPMIATPSFGSNGGVASRLALYLSSRPISKEMYEAVCSRIASNVYCPALSGFKTGCNMTDVTGCDNEDVNFIDYKSRTKSHYYTVHQLNNAVKVVRANCPGKTALEWKAKNVQIAIDDGSSSKSSKPTHRKKSSGKSMTADDDNTWSSFNITENIFKIRVPKGSRLRVCGKIVFKGRDDLMRATAAPVKLSKLYRKIHFEAAQKLQIDTAALFRNNRVASQNGTRLDGIGGFGLSRIIRVGTDFIGQAVDSVTAGPIASLKSLLKWVLCAVGIGALIIIIIIVTLKLLWTTACHSLPFSISLCIQLIKGLRRTTMRNAGKLLNDTKQRFRAMKNQQTVMLEKVLPAKLTNEMLKTMGNCYNAAAEARNEALGDVEEQVKYGMMDLYPSTRQDDGNKKMDKKLLALLINVLKNADLNAYLSYLGKPELLKGIKDKCKRRIRSARLSLKQLTDNCRQQQQQKKPKRVRIVEPVETSDDDMSTVHSKASIETVPYEKPDWLEDLTPNLLNYMAKFDLEIPENSGKWTTGGEGGRDKEEEEEEEGRKATCTRSEIRKRKKEEKDAQYKMRLNKYFNDDYEDAEEEMATKGQDDKTGK